MIWQLSLLFIVRHILPLTVLRSLPLIMKVITQVITGLGARLAITVATLHAGTVAAMSLGTIKPLVGLIDPAAEERL
ncbi:hypothetical protein, partial [uncultured Cobetia sp.]|uniref:hypothetical protein n=1 Tax=uncultured Cobetia sp. TaxID=410706 RepID=UPI0025993746